MGSLTLLGFLVGFGGLIVGQLLEGGGVGALLQPTAAFIVIGGTLGATLVSTTREDLAMAWRLLRSAFESGGREELERLGAELIEAAQIARKESMLALESRLSRMSHPFMRSVFRFAIDGVEPRVLREMFETEIDVEESTLLAGAKVWTDAGGFAPTIGIIGAVLGLIHVMHNLTDTSKLGEGIAIAFVATVYGVGLANLVLLPLGNKIKRKARLSLEAKAMILEGAVAIASGQGPPIVREKIRAYAGFEREESSGVASSAPSTHPAAGNGGGDKASA